MANNQELKFKILASVVGAKNIDDFSKSIDGLGKNSKKTSNEMSFLAKAGRALVAAFTVRELVQFSRQILESADEIGRLGQKTGISVRELASFKEAADFAAVPVNTLTGALKKIQEAQVQGMAGNYSTIKAFKDLGIEFKNSDGTIRSTSIVFKELADRFSDMENGPQKASLAMKLMGKSGVELIPMLNGGSSSLENLGLNIDERFTASAAAFLDNMGKMKTSAQNFAIEGLRPLLPALTDVSNGFLSIKSDSNFMTDIGTGLGETVRILTVGFNDFVMIMKNGIDTIYAGAKQLLVGVYNILRGVSSLIGDGLLVVKAAMTGDVEKMQSLEKQKMDNFNKILKESFLENDKIFQDYANRVDKRTANAAAVRSDVLRNSLLLGNGSMDEIIARVEKEQDEKFNKSKNQNVPSIDFNAYEEFSKKIEQINSEARAIGLSNLQKEKSLILSDMELKGIVKSSAQYNELASGISKALQAREYAKEIQSVKDLNVSQNQNIELKKLELDAIKYSNFEHQKMIELLKTEHQILNATKNFTSEGANAYREAAEAIRDKKLSLMEFEEQNKRSFGFGAKEAIKEYVESVRDASGQMKSVFSNAFKGLEDVLVTFVKNGKLNFRDFANSVIDDLIRIAIRQAIIAPIAGAFGGIGGAASASAGSAGGGYGFDVGTLSTSFSRNGNIVGPGGPIPLSKFANGGVVSSPHFAIFGEGSTPEAFVPLPDGRNIPVKIESGSAKGQSSNNVSVIINMNTSEKNVESNSDTAKHLGNTISQLIQKEIIAQQRPGGLLA